MEEQEKIDIRNHLIDWIDEFLKNDCDSVCMELSSESKLLGRLDNLYFEYGGRSFYANESGQVRKRRSYL